MKLLLFLSIFIMSAFGHFQIVTSDMDIIRDNPPQTITLTSSFAHPFSGETISEEKPEFAKVYINSKSFDLTNKLEKIDKGWKLNYLVKSPNDYQFVVANKPYFEKSENKFIKHIAKVIINGYAKESSWDKPLDLKAEIVALTRPYTLSKGMLFSGIVLFNGEAVKNAKIEIEYLNSDNKKMPSSLFENFIIKSDSNGVFNFVIPWSGWWGFSALLVDDEKLKYKEKSYEVELGAIIWIKAK